MGDLTINNRAPSRRMKAIKEDFNSMNIKFVCISGTRSNRMRLSLKLLFSENKKEINRIYVESSNSGLLLSEALLLLFFKLKKIPISVFIRDAYPLFLKGWIHQNINGTIANILWFISICFYKRIASILYFPAEGLRELINFKNKHLLPPAIDVNWKLKTIKENSIFYTGGLKGPYLIEPILMACDELSKEISLTLTIYCRENDRDALKKWESKKWINIEHKVIEELDFQPEIGVMSSNRKYQSLTRSVKLMDYIRMGMPVVISDSSANTKFLTKHKIGLVADSLDWKTFYVQIKKIISDKEVYNELKENVLKLRKSEEITWRARCKQILNDFEKFTS